MNTGSNKPRTPDLGIGYTSTYKDKDGNENGYLSLMLRVEQLQNVEARDGIIRVSVFPQRGEKKNPKAPDFVVKPALLKASAQKGIGISHGGSTNKFPFK